MFLSKLSAPSYKMAQICPWTHILSSLPDYTLGTECVVTAETMKSCGKTWTGPANQFEPRLLAYQTSAAARPDVFKTHGLSILPVKNGAYLLTKSRIYEPLDYSAGAPVDIAADTSSLILGIGSSETSHIDNLRYAGVFERPEILGERITHGPLLNGRHRCTMDFTLDGKKISASGVQYETDSCFESAGKILIIEGKSSGKPIDSFNIRQLYFPFRECKRLAGDKKEIVCIFVHELRGITHIWKYTFTDVMAMDSIKLLGHYTYRLA